MHTDRLGYRNEFEMFWSNTIWMRIHNVHSVLLWCICKQKHYQAFSFGRLLALAINVYLHACCDQLDKLLCTLVLDRVVWWEKNRLCSSSTVIIITHLKWIFRTVGSFVCVEPIYTFCRQAFSVECVRSRLILLSWYWGSHMLSPSAKNGYFASYPRINLVP